MFLNQLHTARQRFINKGLGYINSILISFKLLCKMLVYMVIPGKTSHGVSFYGGKTDHSEALRLESYHEVKN